MEIKGFITNLGKYNEGELVGEWATFPIDEDEERELRERINLYYEDEDGNEHNTEYEEYFFTDWENINLGEYRTIEAINEMAEEIEDIDEDLLENAIELFSIEDIIEHHEDMIFYGDWHDDYDIGDYYVNESGIYDTEHMGALANYIDYESFGRDIRHDMNGGFTTGGFVEWC